MNYDLDDILRLKVGNRYRVWRVVAIYLGGEDEENLVRLEALDVDDVFKEINVPEDILKHSSVERIRR